MRPGAARTAQPHARSLGRAHAGGESTLSSAKKLAQGDPALSLSWPARPVNESGGGPGRADVNRLSHAACLALAPASTTPSVTPKLPSRARQALDRLGARGGPRFELLDRPVL